MKLAIKALTCFFLFTALTWSQSAIADECADENKIVTDDGRCWNSLEALQKQAIVRGIWVGQRVARLASNLSNKKANYFYFQFNHTSVPSATSLGDITKYFDKLYSFPVNRKISWKHAYLLASLYVRDDDSNDRLSLLTFLRDNDELPTSGELVDVINPSTIVIKSGQVRHEVSIFGLTSSGLSEEHAAKALEFLKGLRLSSYKKDCKKTPNTTVSLSYPQELFNNSGRLHAEVSISKWVYICTRKGGVKINKLLVNQYKDASNIPIRHIMLVYGLGKRYNHNDPKWSKSRKRYAEYFGKANDKDIDGYYSLGTKESNLIELISGKDVSTY